MKALLRKNFTALLHIAFWTGYLLLLLSAMLQFPALLPGVMTQRIIFTLALQMTLFYSHAFYLLPRFFQQKQYAKYVAALLLLCTGMVLLRLWSDAWLGFPGLILIPQNETLLHYLATLVSVVMIVLISGTYRFATDWFVQQQRESKFRQVQLQTELRLLKAQINPHFLFNTLNNIYSLAYLRSEKTAPMIGILSEMLRYMLYECEVPQVELRKELSYLENYLALQRIKIPGNENIIFEKEGNFDGLLIPPMLLIPIVENCFKHGNPEQGGFIHIHLAATADRFLFTVRNSFIPALHKTQGGIGLAATRERLRLLYPDRHRFETEQQNNIFKVEIGWLGCWSETNNLATQQQKRGEEYPVF